MTAFRDYQLDWRKTYDQFGDEMSIVATYDGLVHVRVLANQTCLEFIWQGTLYRRIYYKAYHHRWHGRLAVQFAHEAIHYAVAGAEITTLTSFPGTAIAI